MQFIATNVNNKRRTTNATTVSSIYLNENIFNELSAPPDRIN
jgi:hypothetical protein